MYCLLIWFLIFTITSVQSSGSSLAHVLDNVLHDLVHDPVDHFVHGAVDVVKDLGHGVEHVVDEISHGIHHIGHVFHREYLSLIFENKMQYSCIAQK